MQTGMWDTKVKGRSTSELPWCLLEPPENSRTLVDFLVRAFEVSEKDLLESRKRILKVPHERFFETFKKILKGFQENLFGDWSFKRECRDISSKILWFI